MLIDDMLLEEVVAEAQRSERRRMHRDMRNSVSDKSQRMLNALEMGTILPTHRHCTTSETQILLRGRIDIMFYDDLGCGTHCFHLDPRKGMYGVNIPMEMWHNLKVLESAVIFETKDGAYTPIQPEDILY